VLGISSENVIRALADNLDSLFYHLSEHLQSHYVLKNSENLVDPSILLVLNRFNVAIEKNTIPVRFTSPCLKNNL
jgi:hypothetical protein